MYKYEMHITITPHHAGLKITIKPPKIKTIYQPFFAKNEEKQVLHMLLNALSFNHSADSPVFTEIQINSLTHIALKNNLSSPLPPTYNPKSTKSKNYFIFDLDTTNPVNNESLLKLQSYLQNRGYTEELQQLNSQ